MTTLETLRSEFEVMFNRIHLSGRAKFKDADGVAAFATDWTMPVNISTSLVSKAIRYIIARDFQEFDPERALMLWKLQNGGAV